MAEVPMKIHLRLSVLRASQRAAMDVPDEQTQGQPYAGAMRGGGAPVPPRITTTTTYNFIVGGTPWWAPYQELRCTLYKKGGGSPPRGYNNKVSEVSSCLTCLTQWTMYWFYPNQCLEFRAHISHLQRHDSVMKTWTHGSSHTHECLLVTQWQNELLINTIKKWHDPNGHFL